MTGEDKTPKHVPIEISEVGFNDLNEKLATLGEIKQFAIEQFGLPVSDPTEVNLCFWDKPFRATKHSTTPVLFLYNYRPPSGGDPNSFHATRELLALVRPFKDRDMLVAQTIEAQIYTFYILDAKNDILPDEDAEYLG